MYPGEVMHVVEITAAVVVVVVGDIVGVIVVGVESIGRVNMNMKVLGLGMDTVRRFAEVGNLVIDVGPKKFGYVSELRVEICQGSFESNEVQ
jgi:hypothetical protein